MNAAPWYQQWLDSPYYHQLTAQQNLLEAPAFVQALLSHINAKPGSRMMHTACGTGTISQLIANSGHVVTGIDAGPANIVAAKSLETPALEFFLHDIRLPLHGNYFQYAFNLFDNTGYYRTRREQDDAMRSIAQSLQPGGLFVIDYFNTHFKESRLQPLSTAQIGETYYDMQYWDDETYFYKKIQVTAPGLSEPLAVTEKRFKYSLGDFTDMLSYQGMQVQEVFGNYQLHSYDLDKSERLIIVAKK